MAQVIQISVNLTPALRLEQALKEADIKDPTTVYRLTVMGTIIYDDFRYIRDNMRETLQELDLGNASIIESINEFDKSENALVLVSQIRYFAFAGCIGLKTIIIPNSVTEICYSAFSGCSDLRSITIPDSVTKIGFRVFAYCTALTSVNIQNQDSIFEIKIEPVSDEYEDFTQYIVDAAKIHGKDFSQWYAEEAVRVLKLEKYGGGIADTFYNDSDGGEAFVIEVTDEELEKLDSNDIEGFCKLYNARTGEKEGFSKMDDKRIAGTGSSDF